MTDYLCLGDASGDTCTPYVHRAHLISYLNGLVYPICPKHYAELEKY